MLGCYYSVFKEDRDGTLEHYSPESSFCFHGVLILLSMDSDHFLEEQRESIKLNIKEHIVIKNKLIPSLTLSELCSYISWNRKEVPSLTAEFAL